MFNGLKLSDLQALALAPLAHKLGPTIKQHTPTIRRAEHRFGTMSIPERESIEMSVLNGLRPKHPPTKR